MKRSHQAGKGAEAPGRVSRRVSASTPPARVAAVNSALDLERSIVVLLTMIANQLSASGSLTFQKRHGLNAPEWKVMAVVGALPGSSGAEIAQVLSLDKAAVSRTVSGLSARGLLRSERPSRGNLRAIFLSESGAVLHAEGVKTAREREQALLVDLDGDQARLLHDLLRILLKRMPDVFRLADAAAGTAGGTDAEEIHVEAPAGDEGSLRDRVDRLESLLADVMLENAALRSRGVPRVPPLS